MNTSRVIIALNIIIRLSFNIPKNTPNRKNNTKKPISINMNLIYLDFVILIFVFISKLYHLNYMLSNQ